ncbi:MAG: phenylalanine--tRNA ligase subunit beta [Elusimicrobia bacterium]|nr:phenylalanine--tRNA ligase subunit beta [Elusimicrobiota bacterium]
MRVPINWLKEYIDFDLSPQELEKILTVRGLEVESIENIDGEDVIDIELTPNRGDCASMIGVARELSSYLNKPYSLPPSGYRESGPDMSTVYSLEVKIPENCPAYYLKHIKNVKIGDSPSWLRKRLKACGIRPLNNVIDITNYVLLEYGQPLHAFDASKITGGRIIVRNAAENEEILALDGKRRQLKPEDIVIADPGRAVAIGGVMGGEETSVSGNTRDILVESAFFSPENILKTEKTLGLKTESSYRFARHVDIMGVEKALDRAAYLLQEICSGIPSKGKLFFRKTDFKEKVIELEVSRVNAVLGASISAAEASGYLKTLEFASEPDGDRISVRVPSFRNDVTRPIDVIEELARVHGYDNINPTMPRSVISTDLFSKPDDICEAEFILRSRGYWETVTHSLISSAAFEAVSAGSIKPVYIDNPINVFMDILRPNLLPGLLEVARYNLNQNQAPIKFFERGSTFREDDTGEREKEQLAFISLGGDFYQAKSLVTGMLSRFNQDFDYNYSCDSAYFDRQKNAAIMIDGKFTGEFGCIKEGMLKQYDLKNRQFTGAYIILNNIDREKLIKRRFRSWSPFPSVFRDLSLVSPFNLTHSAICDKISEKGEKILKYIELFDQYTDNKLGAGKKCMNYKLEFNSPERTLTSEEVDTVVGNIVEYLSGTLGITLRPEQ